MLIGSLLGCYTFVLISVSAVRRQKPQDGSKSKIVKRQRVEGGKKVKVDDETIEG